MTPTVSLLTISRVTDEPAARVNGPPAHGEPAKVLVEEYPKLLAGGLAPTTCLTIFRFRTCTSEAYRQACVWVPSL